MSLQKFAEQKRGGDAPFGDIKNNDALKAAAEAGRQALKKIDGALKQGDDKGERQIIQTKRYRQICTCGSMSCRTGPFERVEY